MNTQITIILAAIAACGVSFLLGITWEKLNEIERRIDDEEREARGLHPSDLK